MLDDATAIGASRPIKSNHRVQDHVVEVILNSTGTTKITAATVSLQGGNENTITCVSTTPALADGSTAQRVKTGSANTYYQIKGTNYVKATVAAGEVITDVGGTAITAAITGSKYGGVVMCVDSSGNVRSITPDYGLTTTQAYASAALCNVALDAVIVPSGFCYLGKLIVTAAGGGFTFGTTALTGVSTYYDAYSPFYDLEAHAFTEAELSAQRALFMVTGQSADYVRVFLSALTGAGYITVKYTPIMR
jgi:predicted enzyme related to lactoylglutathione lyase